MLTLYDAPRCPYCARVRIVLAEKGVPHEVVVIDLSDRPAWLYEKNPTGKVPVLEDDGWVLPESAVIDEYLDERYPSPPLMPVDPGARAAARLLVFRHDDFTRPYYALRRGELGAAERFDGALSDLDALLVAMPYLSGGSFGLADIAYVPWVIRAREQLGVELGPHERVSAWLGDLSSRPSIAAELQVVADYVATAPRL
jgi:glutathione S-transferase